MHSSKIISLHMNTVFLWIFYLYNVNNFSTIRMTQLGRNLEGPEHEFPEENEHDKTKKTLEFNYMLKSVTWANAHESNSIIRHQQLWFLQIDRFE